MEHPLSKLPSAERSSAEIAEGLSCLAQHVGEVQAMLVAAEQQLQALDALEQSGVLVEQGGGSAEPKVDAVDPATATHLHTVMAQYTEVVVRVEQYFAIYHQWETLQLSAFQQSELTFSQGQLRRLSIVSRNILRLAHYLLGIPDPEMEQAQLQQQLMASAAAMKFD